jgi:hypothetical protein
MSRILYKKLVCSVSYLKTPAEQFFCDDALLPLSWRNTVRGLGPSAKSLGLLKYTRRPMRHNRWCWELAAVAVVEVVVSADTFVLVVALAPPYLHQLLEGRCAEASEDPSWTAELLGTVLGSTVEEVTVVVVLAVVVFTGETTGVLLLLLAHTSSPVADLWNILSFLLQLIKITITNYTEHYTSHQNSVGKM